MNTKEKILWSRMLKCSTLNDCEEYIPASTQSLSLATLVFSQTILASWHIISHLYQNKGKI